MSILFTHTNYQFQFQNKNGIEQESPELWPWIRHHLKIEIIVSFIKHETVYKSSNMTVATSETGSTFHSIEPRPPVFDWFRVAQYFFFNFIILFVVLPCLPIFMACQFWYMFLQLGIFLFCFQLCNTHCNSCICKYVCTFLEKPIYVHFISASVHMLNFYNTCIQIKQSWIWLN